MVPTWLRQRLHGNPDRRGRAHTLRRPARRLSLEPLEDRWLLSAGPAPALSLVPGPAQTSLPLLLAIDLVPYGPTISLNIRLSGVAFPPPQSAASLQTVVDWGDGARSVDTLPLTNTAFNVIGSHTYQPPKPPPEQSPVGSAALPNSPEGSANNPIVPPEVVIATALVPSRTSATGISAGQVIIQVTSESGGEQPVTNGPTRISIRLYIVAVPIGVQAVSAALDDVSIILALAPILDNPGHLPPVPPVPPGVTGPPWKPSPAEPLPSPHLLGFEAGKGPIVPSMLPGQSRGSFPNFLAGNDPPATVEGGNSGSIRGTVLATVPAADPITDPVREWFRRRARDLAILLHTNRAKAGSPDEPGKLGADPAPEPTDRPAPAPFLPPWLANGPGAHDPVAELLLPEAVPRADRGAPLPPPNAAAAPASYFGELDPAEEAEQEAAATASTRGRNAPARRLVGWPYRLLVVVGCALWYLCWFRHGRFTGPDAPVVDGPRREEAMTGPIF